MVFVLKSYHASSPFRPKALLRSSVLFQKTMRTSLPILSLNADTRPLTVEATRSEIPLRGLMVRTGEDNAGFGSSGFSSCGIGGVSSLGVTVSSCPCSWACASSASYGTSPVSPSSVSRIISSTLRVSSCLDCG